MTWGQQYISAPIASLDKVLKDEQLNGIFLGEMADRLYAKRNQIKYSLLSLWLLEAIIQLDATWMEA